MSGSFAIQTPPERIARLFRTDGDVPHFAPNAHVSPTQPALIIRRDADENQRQLDVLHWGFVPFSTKSLKKARRPINARAETVASSADFRTAFARRRCIVPADAFYEWQALEDGKQSFAISRADGALLAFAGIYESWRDKSGEVLRSFAIITTKANAELLEIHPRAPVVLEEEDWRAWLGEVPRDPTALLRPAPIGVFKLRPLGDAPGWANPA